MPWDCCVLSREKRVTKDDQLLDMDVEIEANRDGRLLFFLEEVRPSVTES